MKKFGKKIFLEKNFFNEFFCKNGDFFEKMIFLTPKMNFSGYGYFAIIVPREKWHKNVLFIVENVCIEKKL